MSITGFALNNSRIAFLAIVAILALGVQSYLTFPSQEDPTITIRTAQITTRFPGMSARRIEDLITRKIEEKVREVPEIEHIRSTSKPGVSIINVDVYERYFDLKRIWQDVRNKVNDIRPNLPEGTVDPQINDDFGNVSVATIMLTADGFSLKEQRDTARTVRDRLYSVPGVKRVELTGVPSERIYLEVNNARLSQLGLNPNDLINTLQRQNIILPGGRLDTRGTELIIEPSGNFESVAQIGRTIIALPKSDQVAYLRDVAKVTRTIIEPPDRFAFYNGKPAMVIGVSMLDGVNIVQFGEALKARIQALENGLKIGYSLNLATFQPTRVDASIKDFSGNLYQTIAIVLVVVMVFLGLRAGLIVGAIVPLTMLLTIIVMGFAGIELHRISIAALIIALGMLVDNGIVVSEDIKRRFDAGDDRKTACIEAGRTLAIPLLTSSLTTILAFAPLLLAVSTTGEFLRSLALVVLITLLGSWFLSMFATPVLCFHFLRAGRKKAATAAADDDAFNTGFYKAYRRFQDRVVRFRYAFLGLMVVAFFGALMLFSAIKIQFMPESDRNQIQVTIDLPVGATSNKTRDVVERLTTWLHDAKTNPAVLNSAAYIAYGGPRFFLAISPIDPEANRAYVLINTKSFDDVKPMIRKIEAFFQERVPEARASVKTLFLGASEPNIVEYRISGPSVEQLRGAAEALIGETRKIGSLSTLKHDWDNRIITFLVRIDQARARRAGLTSEEIAYALNSFFSGQDVTGFREGDTTIPIVLRGARAERRTMDRLITVSVYSSAKKTAVPLVQVANFDPRWEEARIKRRDLERTITVTVRHDTLTATELGARIAPALERITAKLPAGYRVEVGGELESSGKANDALLGNLPVCLLAIVVLLIWQFNSYRRPAIIALTIPLSLIGAIVGLFVMNATFGFTTLLGLLSLAGIIINNAIVLIDQIDQERASGREDYDAVQTACVKRLRPIVISSLTTILGLVPLMLFGGDLWYGMSVAIMFGLALGTVLTLGVIPVLYTIMFGIRRPTGAPAAA